MKNSNFIFLGIGVAAGLLLNSDKGRSLQSDTKDIVQEGLSTAIDSSKNLIETAQSSLKSIKDSGNDYLASINADQVTDKEVSDYIETKVDELKTTLINTLNEKLQEANKAA